MSGFDVGRFLVYPGRRIAGLVTRHGAETDVYAQAISILGKHNVPMLYICSSLLKGKKNRTVIFLDFTDSGASVEDLASELEATGLTEVEGIIKPPVEGFIADIFSERLMAGGSRVIILRDLGYRGFLEGIRERFGSGGAAFLYYIGFETGTGFAKLHKEAGEKVGNKDPESILHHISAPMFQWAGFGRLEIHDASPARAVLSVHGSFECELVKGQTRQTPKPYSQFVRGILAGILSELFGRKFEVTERECLARGDPYCRFEAVATKE